MNITQKFCPTQRTSVRTLDQFRYTETFAEFVARSSEYPTMIERLINTGASLPDNFTCFDVGAGTGKVIQDWLAKDGKRPNRYVAVEPNPAHADSLRKTLLSQNLEGIVIEDNFNPEFSISGTYDLILFSHSLYWLQDPVECVCLAYKAVRPGGCVLIFLDGPFSFYTFFHLFEPLFKRDRPSLPDHGFSSHELVQGLRLAGLEPLITFDPTSLNLTGLFDHKATNQRDEFLSFCLQIEFSELPEPLKTDAITYVETSCIKHNRQMSWPHPQATITVKKE